VKRLRFNGGLGEAAKAVAVPRSRGGTWTRLAKLHKACHPQCVDCGSIVGIETDHVIPLHLGGTNAWGNLASRCHECHSRKSAIEQQKRQGLT
jgi:5-methylcytosine-specific restriction protein A